MKTNILNPKIGIIGKGFVGSAVAHGFSDSSGYSAQIKIYDKDPSRSLNSLEETVNDSDFIFISVPTPARGSGNIDLSIVESLIKDIELVNKNEKNIILLRSTVTPGTTEKMVNNFPSLRFVFNPEFLTERSATFDFLNQSRIILGGNNENTSKVANLYKDRFGNHLPVIQTSFQTAELIKYMNNLFFATKVSFLNEMFKVAEKVDADWNEAIEGFILDGRVAHSHVNVPGPDGKFGFGGSCFPKDIQAFISFGEEIGVDMQVLKGAWQTNLNVRPERDWEKLEGRAVSSNKK
tara:strand:- start:8683 stop:9561 length:879 start_codon:yes stop_codon:yes gene_type:complete